MRPFIKNGYDASIDANATDDLINYTVTPADGEVIINSIGINAGDTHVDNLILSVGGGRIYQEIDIPGTSNMLYPYGLLTAFPRAPLPVPVIAHIGEVILLSVKADSTGVSARTDVFILGTKVAPGARDRSAGTKTRTWIKTDTDSDGIANAFDDIVSHTVTAQTGAITIQSIGIDAVTHVTTGRLVIGDETIVEFDVNAATSSFFPIPEADTSTMQMLIPEIKAEVGETIKLQAKSGSTKFSTEVTAVILGYQEVI